MSSTAYSVASVGPQERHSLKPVSWARASFLKLPSPIHKALHACCRAHHKCSSLIPANSINTLQRVEKASHGGSPFLLRTIQGKSQEHDDRHNDRQRSRVHVPQI